MWQRTPTGAGLEASKERQRRQQQGQSSRFLNRAFLNLTVREYEQVLRAEGVSEKMLAAEVETFRQLKEARDKPAKDRRRSEEIRQRRQVDQSLDPYVEAEIRRQAGVVSDEILQEWRQ